MVEIDYLRKLYPAKISRYTVSACMHIVFVPVHANFC